MRFHLSGLVDAEGYYFEHPAPGVTDTTDHSLFNPRLTFLSPAASFITGALVMVDGGYTAW